jgi:hypothetical protein
LTSLKPKKRPRVLKRRARNILSPNSFTFLLRNEKVAGTDEETVAATARREARAEADVIAALVMNAAEAAKQAKVLNRTPLAKQEPMVESQAKVTKIIVDADVLADLDAHVRQMRRTQNQAGLQT